MANFEFDFAYDADFENDIKLERRSFEVKEDMYSDYIYKLIDKYFEKRIWGENIHIQQI